MRLIDADALCEKIRKVYDGYMLDEAGSTPSDFENMVDAMPTVLDTEKLIEKLKDGSFTIRTSNLSFINLDRAIGLVNQLAEEHKDVQDTNISK